MTKFFLIFQILVSFLLVVFILLQQRGTALGSAFGQGGESFYTQKRGLEKKVFWVTIVLASLFIILSLLNLII